MDTTWSQRRTSRRSLLTGAAALGGAIALPGAAAGTSTGFRTAADAMPGLARNPCFPQSVMAGVPRTDGATLWTRVPPVPLLNRDANLALIVSKNADLSSPVVVKGVTARGMADGTVHEDVTGLDPGEQYFYCFRGQDTESPVGRFQTLRPPDSQQPVRIGFFTCQGFEEGYFAAHRHLAAEDLDLVVSLGDYVYEFTAPGVRGLEFNAYPQTLSGMRAKYPHYRDADLQSMHLQHAFLPIWDDHEFRNNYDKVDWTAPVLSDLDTLLFWQQKKQWAWRAWFEHMPVPRFADDPLRTYRSLQLGGMVELFLQDARQYRDQQGCGDSLGHLVCADADDPSRSMLGASQKTWLLNGLENSSARWKVMANANMMMGMVTDDAGARAYMDTWDGYGAERTEILSTLGHAGVENFVAITGDDHDSFAGELWNTGFAPGTSGGSINPAGDQRVGTEFLVPSVTSHNTGDSGVPAARLEEQNRRAHNPHLKFVDMVQHGYGVLEATASAMRFDYRQVDKLDPHAGVSTSYSFHVESGQPAVEA